MTNNNTITLILCISLIYGATTRCASAEEMHAAAADAADEVREEELAAAADQAPEVAQADRWHDIIQAENMALRKNNNLRQYNELMHAARNGDIHTISERLKKDQQECSKFLNDAIAPEAIMRDEIEIRELIKTILLFEACSHQQLNIINFLLDVGAKINLQANKNFQAIEIGDTCLITAARAGYVDVTQLLIEKGANKTLKNNVGDTALIAASEKGHDIIVKMLLQDGANNIGIDTKDINEDTALHVAIENGHDTIATMLICAGANREVQNFNCKTPLMLAAKGGHDTIVEMLLQGNANNIDIDIKDIIGNTALHAAVESAHYTIAIMLICAGANIQEQNWWGRTPLMFATKYNHPEIVELLLNSGANKQIIDRDGFTALYYAQEHGNSRILNLFTRK